MFLFDDICDVQNCTVPWNGNGYPICAHPAIAVCDLVQNNAIRPLKTYFNGSRQFGMYNTQNSKLHLKNMNANCSLQFHNKTVMKYWLNNPVRKDIMYYQRILKQK